MCEFCDRLSQYRNPENMDGFRARAIDIHIKPGVARDIDLGLIPKINDVYVSPNQGGTVSIYDQNGNDVTHLFDINYGELQDVDTFVEQQHAEAAEAERTEVRPAPFQHSNFKPTAALNEHEWSDTGFFSRVPQEDRSIYGLESVSIDRNTDSVVLHSVSGDVVKVDKRDALALMAILNFAVAKFKVEDIILLQQVYSKLQRMESPLMRLLGPTFDLTGRIEAIAIKIADILPRIEQMLFFETDEAIREMRDKK